MLTRKHFEDIAKIICRNSNRFATYEDNLKFANDFADYLATENPRFDKKQFMEACDLE